MATNVPKNEQPTAAQEFFRAACVYALTGTKGTAADDETVRTALSLAAKHSAAQVLCDYAEAVGAEVSAETKALLNRAKDAAIWSCLQQQALCGQVRELFSADGIPFVLLKGAVTRDLYPEPWMRMSGDLDVLVPAEQFAQADRLLQKNGFTRKMECNHELIFSSPDGIPFELHRSLAADRGQETLDRAWEYTSPAENGTERVFSPTFFFFFFLAHAASHFSVGGCGARTITDLALLQNNGYRTPEAERLIRENGLTEFDEALSLLCRQWMNGEPTEDLAFERYLFEGGVYGLEKRHENSLRVKQKEGRLRHYFRLLFPPFRVMAVHYPVLNKAPVLLPFFWICQLRLVFSPKVWRRVLYNASEEKKVDAEASAQDEALLRRLNLL